MKQNLKFQVQNLGNIAKSEFELGDLTVICGQNNTGKSYIGHATYGFLNRARLLGGLHQGRPLDSSALDDSLVSELAQEGKISFPFQPHVKAALGRHISGLNEGYPDELIGDITGFERKGLAGVFSLSSADDFIRNCEIIFPEPFKDPDLRFARAKTESVCSYDPASDQLAFGIGAEKIADDKPGNLRKVAEQAIDKALMPLIGDSVCAAAKLLFPRTFMVSAERTGVSIFQKELDLTRNRIVDFLSKQEKDFNPYPLLNDFTSRYPVPVRDNIDLIRLEARDNGGASLVDRHHPDIMDDFQRMAGGKYSFSERGIFFIPADRRNTKLTMTESSSSVRSLLILGIYLERYAEEGDLLMIEEPELGLHPHNQRLLARLLAKLVNIGIKVFVTTHSDYIIKELNSLIALNTKRDVYQKIKDRYGVCDEMLLIADRVKAYIIEGSRNDDAGKKNTGPYLSINPANVTPNGGMEVPSYDEIIREMNEMFEDIVWG